MLTFIGKFYHVEVVKYNETPPDGKLNYFVDSSSGKIYGVNDVQADLIFHQMQNLLQVER